MAPVALDALMSRSAIGDRKRLFSGAMVCATICNVKNDWEKNPDGWTPADFLPGARREDDTDRFIREMESGELQKVDPRAMAAFKMKLQKDLNLKPQE